MHRLKGSLPTADPGRYLKKLCHHFRRKIEVKYDERQGLARFPWSDGRFAAREGALDFECSSASAEQLRRVRFVIDEHVSLFSRKSPLAVQWQEPHVEPEPAAPSRARPT